MIRFTLLQFRNQLIAAAVGMAIFAVVLVVTGLQLRQLYDTTIMPCQAAGDCAIATKQFLHTDQTLLTWLNVLVVVIPGLLGIFWGAPLVANEFETGTFRLAWTQSVTRSRWLATKLTVVGIACLAVTGLLTLMVTWWAAPLDKAGMNVYGTFDQRDIVPLGYAAFGFMLGVGTGLVTRRTLPAMAIALAVFVAARLCFSSWVRPDLIAPEVLTTRLDPSSTGFGSSGFLPIMGPGALQPAPPNSPNSWITSIQIQNNAGQTLTSQVLRHDCPGLDQGGGGPLGLLGPGSAGGHAVHASAAVRQGLQDCVAKVGATYHEVARYQPAGHYWLLQWYELAIFLASALILAGICLWPTGVRVRTAREYALSPFLNS